MSDMDVIGRIEKKLGQSLKKMSLVEIEKMDHGPEKAYATDEDNNVVGLWLDENKVLVNSKIAGLSQLSALVLRNGHTGNLDLLCKLKKMSSLCIWSNELLDINFLKELKGLTYLDLSRTKIKDVSILKELKRPDFS